MTSPQPSPLLRGESAPAPRTLVDIFTSTVAAFPESPALDSGVVQLTYDELSEAAQDLADELQRAGVGRGDRVGIRVPSGTTDLYIAILGTLHAGAAYVPVDVDDPDERARVVFEEAGVAAVIGADLALEVRDAPRTPREQAAPTVEDDAWIIFTSGSTGRPKGVAVTHRNAAAFVDAERALFLNAEPLGPGDRVMAGLSVAFDASCEEMWLAWGYGACLVPAPRALVKSGIDVGPWLTANDITVVSTVPTLVSLWPDEALERVRLLILGGEAVPPELARRLVGEDREVWNTYGPTEATVVSCGALLSADGPVRIGLPLDGWDLAVVDESGVEVAPGETGELIIGGVGLARYLDEVKDAEKFAPMPSLGWERAYRSGDLVVNDREGLLFGGRADDQVKVGGRRIELGEIDSALLALPGVVGAATAVRRSGSGNTLLVGYVTVEPDFDSHAATRRLREALPAPLVPRIAVVDALVTRTSGKIDRDALPWPLPSAPSSGAPPLLTDDATAATVARCWADILGVPPSTPEEDFFDVGGGSLAAAQLITLLRQTWPDVAIGDVYDHPTPAGLAAYLDSLGGTDGHLTDREVRPIPRKTQLGQLAGLVVVRAAAAPRWLTWLMLSAAAIEGVFSVGLPTAPWWVIAMAAVVFLSPPGRLLLAAGGARVWLHGVEPGEHPRGGKVHLRLWAAERFVDQIGATNLAGAPYMTWYARLLGAEIGRDVDLHSIPPVTGFLRLGRGASIEPEVDLTGWWVDGDVLHLGQISVGKRARVGTRSMLCPGAQIGDDAEIAPGAAVFGAVPEGEFWSGAPAVRVRGSARGPWAERPVTAPAWTIAYAATASVLALLPALAIATAGAAALLAADLDGVTTVGELLRALAPWLIPATLLAYVVLAGSVLTTVRAAGAGLAAGVHPVQGGQALRVWATMRVLDEARTWLFPLYSSQLTPAWLRLLGARIGSDVEASTVLLIPKLTFVNDQAFLADDTLIGGYELGGGWLRIAPVKIGRRSFVGNSGMAAPGRKVPKKSLVAVLSAAPDRRSAVAGSSWLGSPPAVLRRPAQDNSGERTYEPPRRLRLARAGWESLRVVPLLAGVAIHGLVAAVTLTVVDRDGIALAFITVIVLLLGAGMIAATLTTAAKWILVGRITPGDHPLWSSFVWRNELADTFVEMVAAPWFARLVTGTPLLAAWFRSMGSTVGRGVWCETYWLPETDLVELGDGAVVNQGSVVQTHLFHDRVLSTDRVRVRRGGTLGPNSVVLPAATIGRHATVGPVSLVMRGESVPDKTAWIGNPIGPWTDSSHR